MSRLLKAELFKLIKSRAFRVMCIVSIIMALMVVGIDKLVTSESFIKSSTKGMTKQQQEQFLDSLKSASSSAGKDNVQIGSLGFHTNAKDFFHPTLKELYAGSYGNGVIEILMAILIGAIVAKEYSSGTIKNILAYGKKREDFYLSKLITSWIGTAILLAIIVSVSTIINSFMFKWGVPFDFSQFIGMIKVFGCEVIVAGTTVSLITLISTLTKSNGSTIALGIGVFAILPMALSGLYGNFTWYDNIFKLIPWYNWALMLSSRVTGGQILKGITISLITLILATILGIIAFKKQDIK